MQHLHVSTVMLSGWQSNIGPSCQKAYKPSCLPSASPPSIKSIPTGPRFFLWKTWALYPCIVGPTTSSSSKEGGLVRPAEWKPNQEGEGLKALSNPRDSTNGAFVERDVRSVMDCYPSELGCLLRGTGMPLVCLSRHPPPSHNQELSAPAQRQQQQQQLKQTSDAASWSPLYCRASVSHSGKGTLDVASRALPEMKAEVVIVAFGVS